ncbi:MAG TPA: transposase [Ktedonobacterales bacterium]|nr:transposase [Ktedonobacterales bacterium]
MYSTEVARRASPGYRPPRDPLYARYRKLLAVGLGANPPPTTQRHPGQRGRLAQSPARNLLERLLLDQEAVLALLDDLAIPFDSNQTERDLRTLKVQQKVSNGFRSDGGAAAFTRIRGYLATLRKQGHALLAALETVVAGRPLLSSVRLTYYRGIRQDYSIAHSTDGGWIA